MSAKPERVLGDFLQDAQYPAAKADLVAHAESRGAQQEVLEALQALGDERYSSAEALEAALSDGHFGGRRRSR